jgi:hypothetical protein
MDVSALLEKTDHLVGQFEEHLKLALQITDDPKLQVFLTHLLDEEQEHRQELASLRATLKSTLVSSSHPASPWEAAATPSTEGHYERRDQNVLTVGSLLGKAQ